MVATIAEKTDDIYSEVLDRVWQEENKHPDKPVSGITRRMNGLPVSVKGRRPVIGVELINVEAEREPANISAVRMPGSVLRLAVSSPDADEKPYGIPLAIASDYGESVDESQTPHHRSIGVDIAPGESPKLVVQDADGTWDELPHIESRDAVHMAGAIASALSRSDREVHIVEPLPEDQLTTHSEN